MWLEQLVLRQFRCFAHAELVASPGLNAVLGSNGAGKTSVLEAMVVACSGRSFRAARPADWIRGSGPAGVSMQVRDRADLIRIGVERSADGWQLRLNGQVLRSFTDIASRVACEVFEPDSQRIMAGGAEARRRFLDWGVFHVEPEFGVLWTRYQRALKQRNALLRSPGPANQRSAFEPWDRELLSSGVALTELRERFMPLLEAALQRQLEALAPSLGQARMSLRSGWGALAPPLALAAAWERDQLMGHTTRGAHRCDWVLRLDGVGARERWSRGQQKIAVFALCRAMMEVYASRRGTMPMVCLDDVFSELDLDHQARCLDSLARSGAQVWITGTRWPPGLHWDGPQQVFHVEHGAIRPLDHLPV